MQISFTNTDEYIAQFPEEVQAQLHELRNIIQQAAPETTEVISYGMPAFKQNKVLVYFAANKKHIGFYPTNQPIIEFAEELKKYKTSKGAIQFPLGEPIPKMLVKKIVKFRMAKDKEQAVARKKK